MLVDFRWSWNGKAWVDCRETEEVESMILGAFFEYEGQ